MTSLTLEEVKQIKLLLYEGTPQPHIAEHFLISQSQISRIKNGLSWPAIPWPDSKLGAIDPVRDRALQRIQRAQRQVPIEHRSPPSLPSLPSSPSPPSLLIEQPPPPPKELLSPEEETLHTEAIQIDVKRLEEDRAAQAIRLTELGAETEDRMNSELARTLMDVGESPEAPPPKPAPPSLRPTDWKKVSSILGDHPLVRAADKGDELLKAALGEAIQELPEKDWNTLKFSRLVLGIKKQLGEAQ